MLNFQGVRTRPHNICILCDYDNMNNFVGAYATD